MKYTWKCECGEIVIADSEKVLAEAVDLHKQEAHGAKRKQEKKSESVTIINLIESGLL